MVLWPYVLSRGPLWGPPLEGLSGSPSQVHKASGSLLESTLPGLGFGWLRLGFGWLLLGFRLDLV